MHLRQILFAERTVWIVVQAALQTFEAESVTTGSGDWLIKQSGGMGKKQGFKHCKTKQITQTHTHTLLVLAVVTSCRVSTPGLHYPRDQLEPS